MQISLAKHIGFCSGVKRAIEIVNSVIEKNKRKKNTFCLGPIIHNQQVQEELRKKGVITVYSLKDIKSPGWLILPSHGTALFLIREAKKKRLDIVDTSCPNVVSLQKVCAKLYKQGYQVIIFGDRDHPEIRALLSMVPKAEVLKNPLDIERINLSSHVGVISQTTQDLDRYHSLVKRTFALDKIKELRIFNTICSDSIHRQNEVKNLAKDNDAVFIVGSHFSANTKRLLNISQRINPCSYLIEEPVEVLKKIKPEFRKIGIISGASTPYWVVKQLISYLDKRRKG